MLFQKYINRIMGDPFRFKIEHRVFNFMVFASIIAALTSMVGNIAQNLSHATSLILAVFAFLFSYIYYLSRKHNRRHYFTWCIMLLFNFTLLWFINGGGTSGGMQYYFVYAFVFSLFFLKDWKLYLYLALTVAVVFGLIVYEYNGGPYIAPYPDRLSRYIDVSVSIGLSFIPVGYFIKVIYNEILLERNKSEFLLLNILPAKVAHELKETGSAKPEIFENVTVLFCDIVNFTEKSAGMQVGDLIRELNDIYTAFDTIVENHNCERIKTIGDAYLAVCGLPEPNENHAINIYNASIDFVKFLNKRNTENHNQWEIRIGIHTGQVIGAIIGVKKYLYDIFGDTVNTASRLQTLCPPMGITISEETKMFLGDHCNCSRVESIPVKGKGILDMYSVNG